MNIRNLLVDDAVRTCGSQQALAGAMTAAGFQCVQQTVSKLVNGDIPVDADFAIAIDRATDGVVPKWKLRPDLFDAPTATDAIAVCPHCGDQAAGKTICADPQCPLPVAVRAGEAA